MNNIVDHIPSGLEIQNRNSYYNKMLTNRKKTSYSHTIPFHIYMSPLTRTNGSIYCKYLLPVGVNEFALLKINGRVDNNQNINTNCIFIIHPYTHNMPFMCIRICICMTQKHYSMHSKNIIHYIIIHKHNRATPEKTQTSQ